MSDQTVEYDDESRHPMSSSRCRTAQYWMKNVKPVTPQWLHDRDVDLSPLNDPDFKLIDVFKSKRHIQYGSPLLRAVWYYANHVVFKDELSEPHLVIKGIGPVGQYQYGGHGRGTIIVNPSHNQSALAVTVTVVHEMIHQYNYEVDYRRDHSWTPSPVGSHGDVFKKWIPIVASKLGIEITWKKDAIEDDVTYDADSLSHERPRSKPEYVLLIEILSEDALPPSWRGHYWWLASKSRDEDRLYDVYQRVRQYFGVNAKTRLYELNSPTLLDRIKAINDRSPGLRVKTGETLFPISESLGRGVIEIGTKIT